MAAAGAIALLALVGLGGCTADAAPSQSPHTSAGASERPDGPEDPTTTGDAHEPATASGISVEILQTRPDYARRTLQLRVTNGTTQEVTVVSARFDSEHFAAPSTWTGDVAIGPGLTKDLRVDLATSVCKRGALAGHELVTLGLAAASAPSSPDTAPIDAPSHAATDLAVTPTDSKDTMSRIEREDCLAAAVEAIARIVPGELSIDGSGPGATAALELEVTPSGGPGELLLDSIGPTTLLAPVSGERWEIEKTADAATAPFTVELPLRPARCDPHAIAEDKVGTVLPIAVSLDGGEPSGYKLAVDTALRNRLYEFVALSCGLG
ncbi:hypothetical protein CLV54_2066 [Compostimonas suwonensis]|uniref:Uncharacterized protein n=2 Tax=Compostimonas suwonensis TaxID=1048394 RepID=A0A2M9BWF9_9MICO|nr:hypothetical protein CLV54_2066 [Compostimonas suwonensis]